VITSVRRTEMQLSPPSFSQPFEEIVQTTVICYMGAVDSARIERL